jgi:hypothetical protein
LYIRYLGVENLQLSNKKTIRCIKFSTQVVEGTIFHAGENIIAWVTDDESHVALKVKAKILVGSIIAELVDIKNVRGDGLNYVKLNSQQKQQEIKE